MMIYRWVNLLRSARRRFPHVFEVLKTKEIVLARKRMALRQFKNKIKIFISIRQT